VTVGYENEGQAYLAGDVGRRFGSGDQLGVRANGVRRDGETSVQDESRELSMASLGMDFRGERARFSADLGWQEHHIDAPRPSVTPFGGIAEPPNDSANFAQPWSFTDERDFFGVARGELDVTEKMQLWAAAGVRDGTEHNVLSNPTSDMAGDTSAYRFDNYREDRVTTREIGARTELASGSVGHRLSASGSIFKLDSKNAYGFSDFLGFQSNLYQPLAVAPPAADFFTGGILFSPLTTNLIETRSVAMADTLGFAKDRLLITVGARYQTIEQYSYDYNTGAQVSGYDESTVTPIVGVVFKPADQYSVYANYIEGLIQGEVAPNTVGGVIVTNAGEVFDPFKSKQVELGIKYDRGAVGGTLAVFRITKPSTLLDGTVFSAEGEQRNQGIELSLYGAPVRVLRILGGITLLDAEMSKTQGGFFDGKKVIGVPSTQANASVEWDLPSANGLTVDGRAVYTSSQSADGANTLNIPSWTRLDLGARYATSVLDRDLTLRARVDNVTGRDYWASVGGSAGANYLVLGSPRTFTLSVSVDF
jgi:iron complex outermembrane receptor protein